MTGARRTLRHQNASTGGPIAVREPRRALVPIVSWAAREQTNLTGSRPLPRRMHILSGVYLCSRFQQDPHGIQPHEVTRPDDDIRRSCGGNQSVHDILGLPLGFRADRPCPSKRVKAKSGDLRVQPSGCSDGSLPDSSCSWAKLLTSASDEAAA